MIPRVLVIASHMDFITTVSAYGASKFAKYLARKGIRVKFLYGITATRIPLLLALHSFKPHVVVYSGHGTRDSWVGNDIIFKLIGKDNADWLQKRVAVSAPACFSAVTLGNIVVEEGAYAFLGALDVMYGAFPSVEHNYMKDFVNGFFAGIKEFITENITLNEALKIYKSYWDDLVRLYEGKKSEWMNADFYAEAARNNRDVYTLIGNGSLTIDDIVSSMETERVNMLGKVMKGLFSFAIGSTIALTVASMYAPYAIDVATGKREASVDSFTEYTKKEVLGLK